MRFQMALRDFNLVSPFNPVTERKEARQTGSEEREREREREKSERRGEEEVEAEVEAEVW